MNHGHDRRVWKTENENEMNGRHFNSLAKATSFLKRKKAKVRYVQIDSFEKIGRISVSTYIRIDV